MNMDNLYFVTRFPTELALIMLFFGSIILISLILLFISILFLVKKKDKKFILMIVGLIVIILIALPGGLFGIQQYNKYTQYGGYGVIEHHNNRYLEYVEVYFFHVNPVSIDSLSNTTLNNIKNGTLSLCVSIFTPTSNNLFNYNFTFKDQDYIILDSRNISEFGGTKLLVFREYEARSLKFSITILNNSSLYLSENIIDTDNNITGYGCINEFLYCDAFYSYDNTTKYEGHYVSLTNLSNWSLRFETVVHYDEDDDGDIR